MEKVIWSCNDYSILRVDANRLHDVAQFVVTQNYNHHSPESIPDTAQQEIDEIYLEELSYSINSSCFIVRNNDGIIVGSIRVFRWDKKTPTPMEKIFHISPLEKVQDTPQTSFWHIGRFAIDSKSGFSTITLFKQLMILAVAPILREDDSYMIAETDSHLLKVMNALGIETQKIGNPLNYLASETIPICSNKKGLIKFYQRCYPLIAPS
jgi:N-acyl-L-homoserine lactone synthetase